ncbi:MAG: hypothetical protein KDB53_14625 [Planctomycetes bacterium]|nr:hypothetical protein [Planctomycetota bacterium]
MRFMSILAIALALVSTAQAQADFEKLYRDPQAVRARLLELGLGAMAQSVVVGVTDEGHEIIALEIGRPHDQAAAPVPDDAAGLVRRDWGRKPALLVVAGLEGHRLVGTEVLLRLAENLLALDAAGLDQRLAGRRIYLVPCANPNAAIRNLHGRPHREMIGNGRLQDLDRDGRRGAGEATEDLDGDGMILSMRVVDPKGDLVADAEDPRTLRTADPKKNERGRYLVHPESTDGDGDGRYGEEPGDGVRIDRNFPHGFREHDQASGRYATSEPESRALLDYILARPEIEAVLVYGGHDTFVKLPEAAKDEGDRRSRKPAMKLHPDDKAHYEAVTKLRQEEILPRIEGVEDEAGSLHAWAYYQFGRLGLAANLFQARAPAKAGPKDDDADQAAKLQDPVVAEMEAAWTTGFAEWTAFDHAQLGRVELGGWRPLVRTNPQEASSLVLLASQEEQFLFKILDQFAVVEVEDPVVKVLAPGLFEVRLTVRNTGGLPTALAQGLRNRQADPVLVRVDIARDAILQGDPLPRIDNLPARIGEERFRWVLRAKGGTRLAIDVAPPRRHALRKEITLP